MKKVFSVFMIFLAVFFISCSGLQEGENSSNTVRITMPGNARSASAGGAEDVDHYNIQIASQSFSIVPPGSTVESAPLPVGMSVSISVEAIGKIKENGDLVGSGRRVAYYQTTQTLPAGGLTISVNMANYKMEYHKVTLSPNGFGGRNNEEVYVAGGSSYTLPNYGTDYDRDVPQKHTGWRMFDDSGSDNPSVYPIGASVTITGRTEFELVSEDFATPPSDTPDQPATEQVNITFKQGFILTDNQGQFEWQPFTGASLPQDGNKQKGATVERPEAREEYSFKGWIEGDQAPQTGGLPSSYVTKYTRDMTLSAIWEGSAAVMFDPGNTGFQNQTAPAWESLVYVEKGTQYTLPDYGEYWPDPDDGSTAKKHTGWTYGNGMSALPGGSVTITDNVTFTLTAENLVRVIFNDTSGCFEGQDYWISEKYVAKGGTCELPSYDIGSFDTFAAKHTGWQRQDIYNDPIATYSKGESVTITEDMIDDPDDWTVEFYLQAGEQGVHLQIGSVVIGSIILPDDGSIYERNDSPDGDPYSSLYFIWKDKPFTLPTAKKDDSSDVVTWELTGNDPYAGTLSKPAGAVVTYDEWYNIGSSGLYISPQ